MIKFHEEFQSVIDETILWHYFSLPKFFWMLEYSKLYFSRADRFEDKYEYLITDKEKEWVGCGNMSHLEFEEFRSERSRELFISCWTRSKHELALMWKGYSSPKEGIAIKSTVKKIMDCYKGGKNVYIIPVHYINPQNETSVPTGKCFNTFWFAITKRNLFEQEKEVRLVYESEHIFADAEPLEDFSLDVDLVKLIEEIRVSPNAEEWFVDLIKRVCKRYGLEQIPVSKSEMI